MLLGLASVLLAFALTGSAKEGSCTLSNSGGDDAPALLAAVAACSVVSIPAETTLNISTRLDMTGLQDFHIASTLPDDMFQKGLSRESRTCKGPLHSILIYHTGQECVTNSLTSSVIVRLTLLYVSKELIYIRIPKFLHRLHSGGRECFVERRGNFGWFWAGT